MTHVAKRVAIFLPSLAGGGAEKSMVKLAQGLIDRGHAVDMVLARAEGPFLSEVPRGVQIVDLKAARTLFCLPALVAYLRREQPATLLSTLDYANILALWARRIAGLPKNVVVNEQNTLSLTSRQSLQRRQRMVPRLVKAFYPWANHVVGNSQGVADDLRQLAGLQGTSVEVIYNPVVTPDIVNKVEVQPKHPWDGEGKPPDLLAVGRLTVQKDFPTLLHAFAQVRERHPARLMILGEGPDRHIIELLIKDLNLEDDVCLPGFVDNPYSYMAHSALFVLSSRWEGLPTVLIEALFCGVPIVSTDCPSGPREILADGKYGALVPVEDPSALAEALCAALAGQTPRPTPESWRPYELDTVVDQYVKILVGE